MSSDIKNTSSAISSSGISSEISSAASSSQAASTATSTVTSSQAVSSETSTPDKIDYSQQIASKDFGYDLSKPNPAQMKALITGFSNVWYATSYLGEIASDLGTDMTVGLVWRGDATLDTYVSNYNKSNFFVFAKGNSFSTFAAATNVHKNTFLDNLADENWDIIVTHQGFLGTDPKGTAVNYPKHLEIIKSKQPNSKILHYMPNAWADTCLRPEFVSRYGSSAKMFDDVIKDVEDNIRKNKYVSDIIPGITLIESLKTSSFKDKIYASDGVHINIYGWYACGVLLYAGLTNSSIENLNYCAPVTAEFRDLVKMVVPKVLNDPYTIVDCSAY